MSAKSRQGRARKRERRVRRREEATRRLKTAARVAAWAREERLARLGPLIKMYGEGSEVVRAADMFLTSATPSGASMRGMRLVAEGSIEPSARSLPELLVVTAEEERE